MHLIWKKNIEFYFNINTNIINVFHAFYIKMLKFTFINNSKFVYYNRIYVISLLISLVVCG